MEGTTAVYERSTLFTVSSVVKVSFNKDGNNGHSGQEHKQGESGFGSILAKAVENEVKRSDINVKTNGYTKKGMPEMYLVNMKDYTWQ